jgi:hypothetical protein
VCVNLGRVSVANGVGTGRFSKTLQIRRLSFRSDTLFYVDGVVIQSRSVAAKLSFTTNRDSVLSSHSGCHRGVENVGSSTALRCSNSVVRVDFEATMAAEYLDKSMAEGFSQHSQE